MKKLILNFSHTVILLDRPEEKKKVFFNITNYTFHFCYQGTFRQKAICLCSDLLRCLSQMFI